MTICMNVNLSNKRQRWIKALFTIIFTILKHFGTINQLKMELKSINEKFVHTDNYKIMQHFLQNKVNISTLKS